MSHSTTTLYAPSGEKYESDSRTETTRLVAQGYSEKKPTPKQVEANAPTVKS